MEKPHPLLFSLQHLVADMSLINRNHHVFGSDKPENDIEHSFSVAMFCWSIHATHTLPLDLLKIFKYALVHDFAERYAGDTNAFSPTEERLAKVELEKAAVAKLSQEFYDFSDLVTVINAYEAKADPEALFVWTVDKMQPMILGDMDNWRPYQKLNISYADFEKKYSEQIAHGSPYCKEIFESILEYGRMTYYDRPQGAK